MSLRKQSAHDNSNFRVLRLALQLLSVAGIFQPLEPLLIVVFPPAPDRTGAGARAWV